MTERNRSGWLKLPGPQSFVGWATLLVVLLSALALGANRPVSWTLVSMAVFLLFLCQMLLDALTGLSKPAVHVWPIALIFMTVLAWGIVQTLPGVLPGATHPVWQLVPNAPSAISADPIAGLHIVMRLASYAMIFWIFLRAAESTSNATRYIVAISLFTTLLAIYGLWAAFSGQNPILQVESGGVVRASFVNRNSYATYAVFSVLANLTAYILLTENRTHSEGATRRGLRRFLEKFFGGAWIFAVGFLLCLAALFLTQSRAGAVAGMVALLVYFAAYIRRRAGMNLALLIAPIGLIGFSVVVLTSGVVQRLITTGPENLRFLVYPYIVEGIRDRLMVGHGLGAFENTFRAQVPLKAAEAEWNEAHNSYLENFYELGLPVGALLFIGLIFLAVVIARGTVVRRRNRIFSCMALASIVGVGFHSLLDFSLEIPAVSYLFSTIIGIGWVQAFRRDYVEPR